MKESSWLTDLWFSPLWIFMKYVHLLRKIDNDETRINREGRFKKVRETLVAANLALAVQSVVNQPVYVQLSRTEPPDFFLLRRHPTKMNDYMVTYVEHTSHDINHETSVDLATQLVVTKLKYRQAYQDNYILLIEVRRILQDDFVSIRNLIAQKNIGYKIWIIQYDNTSIDVVAFNSSFKTITADPKHELTRFPISDTNPAACLLKTSKRDSRLVPSGQPDPWTDPLLL